MRGFMAALLILMVVLVHMIGARDRPRLERIGHGPGINAVQLVNLVFLAPVPGGR